MEQLIILAIVALVSLLFNRKKEQPPEQRRPAQRPSYEQRPQHQPSPAQTRTPQNVPENTPTEQRQPSMSQPRNLREAAEILVSTLQPSEQKADEFEQKANDIEQRQLELKMQEEKLRQRKEHLKEKVTQIQSEPKSTHALLTSNEIINGIIMAEVLGPPRAIKPYKNTVKSRS